MKKILTPFPGNVTKNKRQNENHRLMNLLYLLHRNLLNTSTKIMLSQSSKEDKIDKLICLKYPISILVFEFFLFSVEFFFRNEGIQFSSRRRVFNSFVLKMSMTRRLYCRAVSTLIRTTVWASPRLGSQMWRDGIPLSAIFFNLFLDTRSPLFFTTKKEFFSKKNGFF